MELKRIEMTGFKSFPERITVEFSKGVTAIVGPNGSGKSNIADAVRWVLGEQSAKELRGSKMEDVIFAGTERRKALGYCEVTLVLGNEDRKIPLDYEEVSITRRLYRSGESEYAVNGGRCRLRDVQEMLMDTGIGKEGYSLIGQGQIDELLSSRPEERRGIFEEAAGITKYKTRRDDAVRQLAQEGERLSRVSDILNELTSRLEPLKQQAEKAEAYLKLKNELKLYEVAAFIGEYDLLDAQQKKTEEDLSNLLSQLSLARETQKAAKERSESLSRQAGDDRTRLRELNRSLSEQSVEQEKLSGDRKVLLKSQQQAQERIRDLRTRIDEAKEHIIERSRTLEKENDRLQTLEKNISSEQQTLDKLAEEVTEKTGQQTRKREQLTQLRQKNTRLLQASSEAQSALERARTLAEQDEKESAQRFQEETSRREKLDQTAQRLQDLIASLSEKSKDKDEQAKKLEKVNASVSSLTGQEQQAKQKQQQGMLELKDLSSRIAWLEGLDSSHEGYSQAVKALLKAKDAVSSGKNTGSEAAGQIRGTFADIVSVPKQYTLALDTALGAGVQNVVVSTTSAVRELIEYLRRTKAGRATFLPMDHVTARSSSGKEPQILAMDGVIGFACDLVKTDPEYQAVVSRQLGAVVVAKDFESARAVSRIYGNSYRVVTLEGDIFNIGGSITGGSSAAQKNGILSRKSELSDLKGHLADKRQEAGKLYQELSRLTRQKKEALQLQQNMEQAVQELEEQIQKLSSEIHQQEFIRQETQKALQEMQETGRNRQQEKRQHAEELKSAQEACAKAAEELSSHQEQTAEAEKVIGQIGAEISALKDEQGRQAVKTEGVKQEYSFMAQQVRRDQEEMERFSQQHDSLLEESAAARQDASGCEQSLKKNEEQQTALQQKICDLKEQISVQEQTVSQAEQEREKAIEETEQSLRALGGLEKEQVRLENQKTRVQKEVDELSQRMWDEYQITYSAARELAANGFNDDKDMLAASELSKTKRRQNISRLRGAIRDLGDVNVNAVTEYHSLTDRVNFLTGQRDDILESEKNLGEIISQMTSKMQTQFEKGFAQIAESFNRVFREMFGGGQGVLQLTQGADPLEAGIEIIAQPPGKKLQNMTLLSGGEKALTAIALLFAIQQLNPAPFCILDEIEAALDDVNVQRYARFLTRMSSNTQFIVITHRKGTMEAADTMYGVTMEEKGVSKCISVKFGKGEEYGVV